MPICLTKWSFLHAYVQSAQGDAILESVAAIVGDDKKAAQLVAGWRMEDETPLAELEDAVLESRHRFLELEGKQTALVRSLEAAKTEAQHAREALADEKVKFAHILESIADSLPFFIPENVMHEMLEGDFTRARGIFESASHVDFSQYPLGKKPKGEATEQALCLPTMPEPPEFGTAAYGWGIKL